MTKSLHLSIAPVSKSIAKKNDVTVFFLYAGNDLTLGEQEQAVLGARASRAVRAFARDHAFAAAEKEMVYVPVAPRGVVVLVGLGPKRNADGEVLRRASCAVLKFANTLKVKRLGMVLPEIANATMSDCVRAAAEGLALGNYEFDKYKTQDGKKRVISQVTFGVASDEQQCRQELRRTNVITSAVILTRDLANDNSDEVHPDAFVVTAREQLRGLPVKITIFDERRIQKEGMNLLYAVGRASKFPPRFMIIEYRGNPASKDSTALVGKGVTFDTGGVNLKPTDRGFLEDMHMDMSGAAAVLATLKVAAELKMKVNLLAVTPLAENAIGGHSYKPGSVLRSYAGKSVEIKNTDAEGRLILADAIAYIIKKYAPTRMIDIATLTGHCIIALGEHAAGLFSNSDSLANALFEAGERTRERVWRFPLYKEYSEEVKGVKGDLQNSGKVLGGAAAGAITAATFLQEFVGKTPWAHIDIAGPAMSSQARDYIPKGGTGFGVRLLVDYLTAITE